MDSEQVFEFNLNGNIVNTYVTTGMSTGKMDSLLKSFFSPNEYDKTHVIGFDVEFHSTYFVPFGTCSPNNSGATLQLCHENSCLIVQHSRSFPLSLRNFLRLPNYTFVGLGITENMDKLEKLNGLRCRNVVELGSLAASALNNCRLIANGVDELACRVCRLDLRSHRSFSVIDEDWDTNVISEKQAEHATVNVYSYFMIGKSLIDRYGRV